MASSSAAEPRAAALLAEASDEADRSRRHLLVAAALGEVLSHQPVVVGGAAEDHYTADVYVETDLDLFGWVLPGERAALSRLGFRARGRHWVHQGSSVAVEFPESTIDGDEDRIVQIQISGGVVAIIGVDDLYLDRIRQSTAEDPPVQQHAAALALAVANLEVIDWPYVGSVIDTTRRREARLGALMSASHRRVRATLKRAIDAGEL